MTQVAEAPAAAARYVGGGVLRKEDPELVTGHARYVDNISLPGMLWIGIVRSPFGHARITSVELSRAREMPGVIAAFSGEDLAGEWAAGLPCAWPIANRSFPDPTTEDPRAPDHWPVAKDKARHAGVPVAVIVAESRALAADAVEAVEVDYDPLDPVLDLEDALKPEAAVVHEDFEDNRCYTWGLAAGDVDRVFSEAPVVVLVRLDVGGRRCQSRCRCERCQQLHAHTTSVRDLRSYRSSTRRSSGPATSASTTFPAAWAMLNGTPAASRASSAASVCG